MSFARHEDKPFRVVGILAATGTPVDRTMHVSLEAIEAIHVDWQGGAPLPGQRLRADQARALDLTPKAITAGLVGLKSRVATFQVQRFVNDYRRSPCSPSCPAVALAELWGLIGVAEGALLVVSACVVVVGLFGMLTALLTSLNERRREMAILRSVGARPLHVFALIMGESFVLTLVGVVLGLALLYGLLVVVQPVLAVALRALLALGLPGASELLMLGAVVLAGAVVGLHPGLSGLSVLPGGRTLDPCLRSPRPMSSAWTWSSFPDHRPQRGAWCLPLAGLQPLPHRIVHPRLPPLAGGLESGEHVRVEADRGGHLGGRPLGAATALRELRSQVVQASAYDCPRPVSRMGWRIVRILCRGLRRRGQGCRDLLRTEGWQRRLGFHVSHRDGRK